MATGKRYYWIKLTDIFMNDDPVDYLMQQTNGANYVVLYQMMCLSTKNNNGRMCSLVGDMLLRWDEQKIARECKWFSVDTIRVALTLFQRLGLIYEECDGVFAITGFDKLVGSETDYAAQKRLQRSSAQNAPQLPTPELPQIEPKKDENAGKNEGVDNVHADVHSNVHTEKDIDKDIDIDINKEKEYSSVLSFLPEDQREKMLGELGEGIVVMSDKQFDELCKLLSLYELHHYFEVIKKDEREGRHYTKRTHFQAIKDMAAADRKL